MLPSSNQTSQRRRLYERESSVSMRLKAVEQQIARDIRSRGFGLLRKGVGAFTHTADDWAERQVLSCRQP